VIGTPFSDRFLLLYSVPLQFLPLHYSNTFLLLHSFVVTLSFHSTLDCFAVRMSLHSLVVVLLLYCSLCSIHYCLTVPLLTSHSIHSLPFCRSMIHSTRLLECHLGAQLRPVPVAPPSLLLCDALGYSCLGLLGLLGLLFSFVRTEFLCLHLAAVAEVKARLRAWEKCTFRSSTKIIHNKG